METPNKLSHVDQSGAAQMVDVGGKPVSRRSASASVVCCMQPTTRQLIDQQQSPKGDVLQIARVAAISGSKRTDELIPLCHSVPMDRVAVEFDWLNDCQLRIRVTATATGKTGVEMEALVGASIAALTIYDMCKAVDRSLRIDNLQLDAKSGGVRGDYIRDGQ